MDTAPLEVAQQAGLPPHGSSAVTFWPPLNGNLLTPSPLLDRAVGLTAKRALDLTAAVVGLTVLAPVLLLIALLVVTDSPGPVLFRQRRLGRQGRPFWIYKFRTMRAGAEAELPGLESCNESEKGVLFKMRHDPRVTRLGRFLRRTNLDELPQLINVLKGEMSLVGPRPFQERDCLRLESLDRVGFARRLELPPGLTGSWQVGRLDPTDSGRLLELDLFYVQNWSLALDLHLLYRTMFIVLAGFRNR
jgi:lipopolysaccharide/colanic/teichoic acid biosynthesis glycosyltransferase